MNGKKRPDQQSQLTLRTLLNAAYRSLRTGLQQLRTAKGLVALAPLVVSVAAYLRASVTTDELFFIMPNPIVITIPTNENAIKTPEPAISAFFSKSGATTLYVSRLAFNLQQMVPGGAFDRNCRYSLPPVKTPGGSTQTYSPPYLLVPRVMNKNYPYQLPQGFLVEANQFVPIDLKFVVQSEATQDQQLTQATGGIKITSLWQIEMIELVLAQKAKNLTMCISAIVMQPGEPAKTVSKVFSTDERTLLSHYEKRDYGKVPIAPGGQDAGHPVIYSLSVQGSELDKGVRLYRNWKFSLF